MNKLILAKVSADTYPAGSTAGIEAGIELFTKPELLKERVESATTWVTGAIALIKSLPDNPYGDDDELIAAKILADIESRNK